MILEFSTKKDINGNRYYLGICTTNKTFSRERGHWYSKEDVIVISKTDRRKMIDELVKSGFTEVNTMF